MSLLDDIRRDTHQVLTDTGTAPLSSITLTTAKGYTPITAITVNALAVKHNFAGFDASNSPVTTKIARVTFSEQALINANYPVRDSLGNIILKDNLISFIDNAGYQYNAIIRQIIPDETTGNIVCMLGDYKGS